MNTARFFFLFLFLSFFGFAMHEQRLAATLKLIESKRLSPEEFIAIDEALSEDIAYMAFFKKLKNYSDNQVFLYLFNNSTQLTDLLPDSSTVLNAYKMKCHLEEKSVFVRKFQGHYKVGALHRWEYHKENTDVKYWMILHRLIRNKAGVMTDLPHDIYGPLELPFYEEMKNREMLVENENFGLH